MGAKEEGTFTGKGLLIGKIILLWLLSMIIIFIWACISQGETLALLMVEVKSGFIDNPVFLSSFLKKWIFVSAFFGALLVIIFFTENFSWTLGIGKWSGTIRPGTKNFGLGSRIVTGMAVVVCLCMTAALLWPQMRQLTRGKWKGDQLIAHACGGIDDTKYTNSLDALANSYELGFRTIEVDFALTEDNKLVCYHMQTRVDPDEGIPFTENEFLNSGKFSGLTLMSLETLLEQMREREDLWIVTDTKNVSWGGTQRVMRILVETAQAMDCMDVLDRFVVQIYNYETYDAVEEIYSFNNYIFTLYRLGDFDSLEREQFYDYCRFCKTKGIGIIAMFSWLAEPEILEIADRYEIDVYVYTINNMDRVEELQAIGVKGFYTDFITPEMMEYIS